MEKIIKHNGLIYYHASKYREEKKISYQQMNNLLHGKKYKKRSAKKGKYGSGKGEIINYIAPPKFKKGTDYIVRGGFIYVSEEVFANS